MSSYVPSPNELTEVHIPDDGVTELNAASVGVPFEELADGIQFLDSQRTETQMWEYLSDATITVPPSVTRVIAVGCGGGGAAAGGTGAPGTPLADQDSPGGGGGGGAPLSVQVVDVVPGETLRIYVGVGGNPASTGQGGASRINRPPTHIADPPDGIDIAILPGGGAGTNAAIQVDYTQFRVFAAGGPSRPFAVNPAALRFLGHLSPVLVPAGPSTPDVHILPPPVGMSEGGFGHSEESGTNASYVGTGGSSPTGFSGGTSGGVRGTDIPGSLRGGGSGGGGGAGPFGSGANGGKGGDASNAASVGANGVNGQNAAPNTGAGGGGGGSGGQGTSFGRGTSGTGGAGGSGRVRLYFEIAKADI